MTTLQSAIMVGLMALVTFGIRVLPFVAFPKNRPTPRYVLYLGRVLPYAVTAMLVVYCLKDITPFAEPYALPELIAIAAVALLFLLFKNTLVAIAAGTILYMLLVQLVF